MRRALPSLVAAVCLLAAGCGGSDDATPSPPADSSESTSDDEEPTDDDPGDDPGDDDTSDDGGDDDGLVAGFEPIGLRVSLPGGAVIEADAETVTVKVDAASDPSQQVPWSDLVAVARALDESGVNLVNCLEPDAIWVNVQAPDQVTFVSGSVCDGMPEAPAVRAALAPLEVAIGSGVLDVENGRLPDSDLETGGANEVTYYFSRGAEFIELTVTETTATASTDSGNTMIALSAGDFTTLVNALRDANLSEDSSECAGGPVNGVTITLEGEETLVRDNNPCEDDSGFAALNEVVAPLLERMGLDAPR